MPSIVGLGASPDFPVDVDLEALHRFATVAEHLHFGRAAAALHIPRPRLSRTVTELEAALKVELFVRPSEVTELTTAGRALLDRARSLLAEAEAEAEAGADAGADGAHLPSSPAFTIAIVPGVTISKWTRAWAERRPELPVQVLRTDPAAQITVLRERVADVAFVRLPVPPQDAAGLSTIPLYAEVAVVVVPKDHVVTLVDSVSVADLASDHLLQDPDTVPEWRDAALALSVGERPPLPAMASTADAIALVAAGLGIVIVPQSVARLNHRKDVTYRPVVDVAQHRVALAWLSERTTADVEEFIGIVRGRSAQSSRTPSSGHEPAKTPGTTGRRRGSRWSARPT